MIDPTDLAKAFGRNANIINSQAKDLTHADSLIQPPFHGNCFNWVLGHLVANHDDVLDALGEPRLFEGRLDRYKRESESLTHEDKNTIRFDELVEWFERGQIKISESLNHVDNESLSREIQSGDRKTTVGQRVFFLYFHETYHVGQTELFRQLAGKNDKVI
ncbi:MAG: DinB family protein [Anaerolineales bacterium]